MADRDGVGADFQDAGFARTAQHFRSFVRPTGYVSKSAVHFSRRQQSSQLRERHKHIASLPARLAQLAASLFNPQGVFRGIFAIRRGAVFSGRQIRWSSSNPAGKSAVVS